MDNEPDRKPDEFVAFFKRLFVGILRLFMGMVGHLIGEIVLIATLFLLASGYNSESSLIRITAVLAVGLACLLLMLGGGLSLIRFIRSPTTSLIDQCMYALLALMGLLTGASVLFILAPGMIDRLSWTWAA